MTIIGDTTGAGGPPGAGDSGGWIKETTDQTFMQDVIEASKETPVIVDFWAPWCGPCKQLGPALENAVNAAGGAVRMVKINVDENQHIAQQLQVQSIPAVFVVKDGQPIDGFQGALPESQVKQFVDKHAGGQGTQQAEAAAEAIARGDAALAAGDANTAAQEYMGVLQADSSNAQAVGGLARCYLAVGEPEKARELLDQVPEEMQNHAAIEGARTALSYAEADADPAEIDTLRAAAEAAPDDFDKRMELAKALSARGKFAEAMDALLTIVEADKDWNEGAARAELLNVFEAAGPASEETKAGRRRLSSLLFS